MVLTVRIREAYPVNKSAKMVVDVWPTKEFAIVQKALVENIAKKSFPVFQLVNVVVNVWSLEYVNVNLDIFHHFVDLHVGHSAWMEDFVLCQTDVIAKKDLMVIDVNMVLKMAS